MQVKRQRRAGLRHLMRVRWTALVALVTAGFIAFLPVAQAYCAIDLPVKGSAAPAASTAHDHGGSHRGGEVPDPCCDHSPIALASSDGVSGDIAAGPARAPEPAVALVTSVVRASSVLRVRHDMLRGSLPPPEPRFRRLKRLLV